MACFASNVDRVQQIIDAAVALGRKVSFVGRSMVRNMGIARELGFLNVADDDVLDIGAAEMMPADRVVLVTTGTQGEPMAALSRMSRGEHRSITLTAGDLIILSSLADPGQRGSRSSASSTRWPRSAPAWSPIAKCGSMFRATPTPVSCCSSTTGCGRAT